MAKEAVMVAPAIGDVYFAREVSFVIFLMMLNII